MSDVSQAVHANISVNGIVQGVGFRPFIHRLTGKYSLCGWIRNTSQGAEIELEGKQADIEAFVQEITEDHPPLADIISVRTDYSEHTEGFTDFRIINSDDQGEKNTLISPDIGICEDCRKELLSEGDRRYRYPFINCTNCGPRFTIIRDVPYDRVNTSMAEFAMCPDCDREYHDIADRRYHAQPDCCPECGPQLAFLDGAGRAIPGDAVDNAVQALKQGLIVAVKGLGGFHLACRADDAGLAMTLRHRKQRDEKPFAIMCRDVETVRTFAEVSDEEAAELECFRKPIVLLKKKDRHDLTWLSENAYIGVMLPYTPLHVLLLEQIPSLVMTSANLSDLPIIYKNDQAARELAGIADRFLVHDRDIVTRCDDSLVRIISGDEYLIRRSRGYVPYPVMLDIKAGQTETDSRQSLSCYAVDGRQHDQANQQGILACGAEQKASFALTKGEYAFPSQHIGDLKNIETFENYETQIRHFERMFDINVSQIVCDMHPDLMSTRYAEERAERDGVPVLKVQHHHAHMASCMADNGLTGDCIGIIWDGTGYGTDGTIWGGEFLVGGYGGASRAASIRPIRLAGGDRAVTDIWRCGAALLEDAGIDSGEMFPGQEADTVRQILKAGINCPVSTGMGRLFDGVSALLGIRTVASYEGQGAVLLEADAGESESVYPYEMQRLQGDAPDKASGMPVWQFDYREMIRCIYRDIRSGRDRSLVAADFMNTLSDMAVKMCLLVLDLYNNGFPGAGKKSSEDELSTDFPSEKMNQVVLSGGTFQNMYLLEKITKNLENTGFFVYRHHRVSCNDEGISFGQAAIVSHIKSTLKKT